MTVIRTIDIGPCIDHGRMRSLRPEGYAMVGIPGKSSRCTSLHRLVYCEHNGVALDHIKGLVIRHACDNPRCINPAHLVLGTRGDNNRDRAERGRSAKRVPSRQKLTRQQVAAIRTEYDPSYGEGRARPRGVAGLARRYGVDTNVIYRVIRGEYHADRN